jgi:hypothetical protein
MTKVFIGGSRRIARLDASVRLRLDEIIKKELPVLVGDANGADKAVQKYFQERDYSRVEVFCSEGHCRNNLGSWKTRAVPAPHKDRRDFEYYAAKDRLMAEESSLGFMLWDGKSRGTLANVERLIGLGKKAVVYVAPLKEFRTLKNPEDWEHFVSLSPKHARPRAPQPSLSAEW